MRGNPVLSQNKGVADKKTHLGFPCFSWSNRELHLEVDAGMDAGDKRPPLEKRPSNKAGIKHDEPVDGMRYLQTNPMSSNIPRISHLKATSGMNPDDAMGCLHW